MKNDFCACAKTFVKAYAEKKQRIEVRSIFAHWLTALGWGLGGNPSAEHRAIFGGLGSWRFLGFVRSRFFALAGGFCALAVLGFVRFC